MHIQDTSADYPGRSGCTVDFGQELYCQSVITGIELRPRVRYDVRRYPCLHCFGDRLCHGFVGAGLEPQWDFRALDRRNQQFLKRHRTSAK